MIRIAICYSDEQSCYAVRDCLNRALAKSDSEYKAELFFDSAKLFDAMHDRLFEYIICDTDVGDTDMVEFIRCLRAERYPAQVVFAVDGYSRLHDALEVFPLAFIKKIPDEKLINELLSFIACFRAADKRFYVSAKNGEKYLVDENEIEYIEVFRNDICIHTGTRDITCRYTLTGFLKRLGGAFVRCHQSYAVNMERAAGIRRYCIELSGGKTVPISKQHYKLVRDRFAAGKD